MANKMLIDASHPEETRVVVLRGNRVEEFDFESASRKQLRGNIYLAKVTRVEPSLQAAFIEYGGNRHGFLAFSEIHPDYYQIPVADRQALLEEEERAHAEESEEETRGPRRSRRRRNDRNGADKRRSDPTISGPADEAGADAADMGFNSEAFATEENEGEATAFAGEDAVGSDASEAEPPFASETPAEPLDATDEVSDPPSRAVEIAPLETTPAGETIDPEDSEPVLQIDRLEETVIMETGRTPATEDEDDDESEDGEVEETVEQIGGDSVEEYRERRPRLRRQYKIQEVIKRRQVLLVQVVKEERGTKGAALTTYLSLAGRYSVLMPNTARGGGVSRKITEAADRKRMKEIAQELEVPDGMGVILRTAGASRTKPEVKRDFEYLLRMWENVRELTLQSSAPSLVYEEGSLVKRSIRDLYGKEVEEVVVAGDEGFKEARGFMRLLMPSHVANVKLWNEPQAIFAKMGVESQLDSMFSNVVTLRSGGYLVINQTEALVAIDVNSGRSTREHNIEDTALRTNLEASDEVARQLRLRDLAGLVVVDFIDMEEHRNNRSVERRLKDALKNDRARIQVGRISHFGLLEMSRQRIRTGVLEGSSIVCPHCAGSGHVRSTASIALNVLRILEDALVKNAQYNLIARVRIDIALYMLNQKRAHLSDLEHRFSVSIAVMADDTLTGSVYHAIERGEPATPPPSFARNTSVRMDSVLPPDLEEDEIVEEAEDETAEADGEDALVAGEGDVGEQNDEAHRKRRKRRRRGRGQEREWNAPVTESGDAQPADDGLALMAEIGNDFNMTMAGATVSDGDSDEAEAETFTLAPDDSSDTGDTRPKRRSRRGGRRRRNGEPGESGLESGESLDHATLAAEEPTPFSGALEEDRSEPATLDRAPEPDRAAPTTPELPFAREPAPPLASAEQPPEVEPTPAAKSEAASPRSTPLPEAAIDPNQPKRSGWWQRAKQTFGGS